MDLFERIFTEDTTALKEFDAIDSVQKYTLAYNQNHEVFCWFYDLDGLGLQLIEKYYEHNKLNKFDIHIHNKKLRNRSPEVKALLGYKICILDNRLVTYNDVIKHAETHQVKGYRPGKLKKTLNKFETIL
jgi:hypothetical protein